MKVLEQGAIFKEIVPMAGFYPVEQDELGAFLWTRKHFTVMKPEGIRYVELLLCYYGLNGKLIIGKGAADRPVEITLSRGWNRYAVDLSGLEKSELDFEVTPLVPVPGDSRELGAMIRNFRPFQHVRMYELARKKMLNKSENVREFFSGCSLVNSRPTRLRIDMETRCNMIPRCSYCEWQRVKEMEENSPLGEPLTIFEELGDFFESAEEVIDCGYGEPLLNPNLEAILDEIANIGARFEMTSNGHLLDRRNRSRLLGKDMILYISIDAATDSLYRRYRHGSLDTVVKNLQALCREKRDHSNLPQTIASFIAMRSNLREFEPFLNLMAEVGVDAVKLRSLNENPTMPADVSGKGSTGFSYQNEILSRSELMSFQYVAQTAAKRTGITLVSELDFCKEFEDRGGPICSEPWQTLYVLKRGLMPCCFSRTPLAPWDPPGKRPLTQFIADVWNGSLMREIREALKAGEFHDACKAGLGCSIVKRKSLGS